ncbi:MAG: hypothetical protein WCP85_20980 [Mariniphaga sp.]
MHERINLTGRWRFQEDFGFGKDSGYAELFQIGNHLKGVLRFSEQIDGEETFIVKQEVSGKINGKKIRLKSHSCEILFSDEDIIYELDTWHGDVQPDGKIIGVSSDAEGTGGLFTMERESLQTSDLKDDHYFGFN